MTVVCSAAGIVVLVLTCLESAFVAIVRAERLLRTSSRYSRHAATSLIELQPHKSSCTVVDESKARTSDNTFHT